MEVDVDGVGECPAITHWVVVFVQSSGSRGWGISGGPRGFLDANKISSKIMCFDKKDGV